MYPALIDHPKNAIKQLEVFCQRILFKDIFSLVVPRKPNAFMHLVKLLADRIGSEVSYDGLARETGLSKGTVADYIKLLEECFIVKSCDSFSRNLANEIKKGKKIYFCDLGIRNAVLKKYAPISNRDDVGALWENFFFMERVKWLNDHQYGTNLYFWRTMVPNSKEIDFVEEYKGEISTFECKFSASAKAKMPLAFTRAYGDRPYHVVTPQNIWEFVSAPE